ncbi:thioredoxin H-type 1-like [Impatiens glandulifera]|uniref:thioredoxin H-type 1-like n=1 Tax=Impatiens glandulifera TaxID=253017 RepID=UPI001FB0E74C|nr:thioredoxin H-type 1-like [Impatiens glandulifera]
MASSEEGQVIGCHSLDAFEYYMERSNEPNQLVVINFTATWSGPCSLITPVLAELAKEFPQVIFIKVDVDELRTVSIDFRVDGMPTFLFVKEGIIVDGVVGARVEELKSKTNLHS